MLLVLAVTLYITLICLVWGMALLQWMSKLTDAPDATQLHFSLTCLAGLTAITALAGLLSLFVGLGTGMVQLLLLALSLCLATRLKKRSLYQLTASLQITHLSSRLLLAAFAILLLLMCSWTITHPDTLGYHIQTIEWIRQYKVIPGLVHIDPRLGYQGLWFPVNALFSAPHPTALGSNLLNCAVVFWFVLFVVTKIDQCLIQQKASGLLWLFLLLFSFWQYTQLRLTATSASPDFVVMALTWAVLYLLVQQKQLIHVAIAALFSFTAIAIKLSAFPIIIPGLYALLVLMKNRKWKSLLLTSFLGLMLFSAFLIRNSITSGYPLYPSPFPDLVRADWKQDKALVTEEKNYITAYARLQNGRRPEEIGEAMRVKMQDWLPPWWQRLALSDKTLLVLLLFSFVAGAVYWRRIAKSSIQIKIGLLTMFTGLFFWFFSAPDVRFGSGFIIGFIGLLATAVFLPGERKQAILNKFLRPGIYSLLAVILLYCGYRVRNFYTPKQVVYPVGIVAATHTTIRCGGVPVMMPSPNATNANCNRFGLRGRSITDGFKAAQKLPPPKP